MIDVVTMFDKALMNVIRDLKTIKAAASSHQKNEFESLHLQIEKNTNHTKTRQNWLCEREKN